MLPTLGDVIERFPHCIEERGELSPDRIVRMPKGFRDFNISGWSYRGKKQLRSRGAVVAGFSLDVIEGHRTRLHSRSHRIEKRIEIERQRIIRMKHRR